MLVMLSGGCSEPQSIDRAFADCNASSGVEVPDIDGDGFLTDADMESGDSVLLLRWFKSGNEGNEGYSIHVNENTIMFPREVGGLPSWAVRVGIEESCKPEATMFLWFRDMIAEHDLRVGELGVFEFAFDIPQIEVYNDKATRVSGSVHIPNISDGKSSGYFDGSGELDLYGHFPEVFFTGQTVQIVSLAFRDIDIEN